MSQELEYITVDGKNYSLEVAREAIRFSLSMAKDIEDLIVDGVKVVYTVPQHVGQIIEVPKGSKIVFYDPSYRS